jgi:dTDP-4-amino-4,6-dideoxygalactose transaminase
MSDWKVPLAAVHVPEADIAVVAETYRSGWLSMGPRTVDLEHEFARYTGAAHAVAVTNGTAALHLICLAAGLGPGDEVIAPSLTFVASVNAVRYTGASVAFADIESLERPWLSAESVRDAVTPRTRAIMAVHYGGHPGQIERLAELAAERGIVLLEDAAHAAGSRLHGRHLGTFGAASAFSFFSNKNLAVGEGGMVLTEDAELAAQMRTLRSHGMTSLSWDRHRGHATDYDVVALGFNYRIDEPRSALALARLARLDDENARRARLAARYRQEIARVPGITPALDPVDGLESANHLFTAVLAEGVDRDELRAFLAARGIQTSLHYPPAHRFAVHAQGAPELPLTDEYAERAVTLPLFADMTDAQQDLVLEALSAALDLARVSGLEK